MRVSSPESMMAISQRYGLDALRRGIAQIGAAALLPSHGQ